MYCPRCGQEQAVPEVRFCSRCGFDVRGVSQLLLTGGVIPGVGDPSVGLSPRKRGVRTGGKILFAALVSLPIALAASIAADNPGPLILPVFLFFLGVARMLYAALFQDAYPSAFPAAPPMSIPLSPPQPMVGALPAYQSPISMPSRPRTTGELAQPPSVTEHTTRHLEQG